MKMFQWRCCFALGVIVLMAPALSSAITLSASQRQQVKEMSPLDRSVLAKKAGIKLPKTSDAKSPDALESAASEIINPLNEFEFLPESSIEKMMRERFQSLGGIVEASDKVQSLAKLLGVEPTPKSAGNRFLRSAKAKVKVPASWQRGGARRISSQLEQFGYDLFASSPTTFAPVTEVPIPAEYVLGPGDQLNIHLYGREDEDITVVIDREGEIQFPAMGSVAVAGMTFVEAKTYIAQLIKEKRIGVTVDISMGELRSIRVFVLGDVNQPGSYLVSGLSTISNALFVSGGVHKRGSLRHITHKRAGRKIAELDLYDFLLRGDSSRDARLLAGDVIFVPPIGEVVAIVGEVVRPAIYELKNTHAGNVAQDILKLAGGALVSADRKRVQIDRFLDTGDRKLFDVDVSAGQRDVAINNGDLIMLFPVSGLVGESIQLSGHVKRPGTFGLKFNMRLSDLIRSREDLLPDAFMDYMFIQRIDPVSRDISFLRFPLGQMLEDGYVNDNPALMSDDKIVVFSNSVMKQQRSVKIRGAVKHAGEFTLGANMRLLDLLMVAGGPNEKSYLKRAELTRYTVVDGERRVSKRINIDLTEVLAKNDQANLLLQPYDELMVRELSNWKPVEHVELKGEFRFPGAYTIQRGESLEQVIARAGGLTSDAYTVAAVFSRESIRKRQQKAMDEAAERLEQEMIQLEVPADVLVNARVLADNQRSITMAQKMLEKIRATKPIGRLLIDLDEFGKLRGGSTLHLQDGDTLVVQKRPDEVMVMGAVNNESAFLYRRDMKRDGFIDLAGGLTALADDDRIYIVRANGYVEAGRGWNRKHRIYPGDTIVVPQTLETFNLLQSTLDWSEVLMRMAIFSASLLTLGVL